MATAAGLRVSGSSAGLSACPVGLQHDLVSQLVRVARPVRLGRHEGIVPQAGSADNIDDFSN